MFVMDIDPVAQLTANISPHASFLMVLCHIISSGVATKIAHAL